MGIEEKLNYEDALKQLQEIVNKLENKEIKLDDLSISVKEAKRLVDYCRDKLDKTEEEIRMIIEPENDSEL
jgi:exodeoxyribonuclease VII small subunit